MPKQTSKQLLLFKVLQSGLIVSNNLSSLYHVSAPTVGFLTVASLFCSAITSPLTDTYTQINNAT